MPADECSSRACSSQDALEPDAVKSSRQRELLQELECRRLHVEGAVNAADPEGLLALGAPSDEYEPEIDELTRLLQHGQISEERVLAVWEKWFGPGSNLQRDPARLAQLTAQLLLGA